MARSSPPPHRAPTADETKTTTAANRHKTEATEKDGDTVGAFGSIHDTEKNEKIGSNTPPPASWCSELWALLWLAGGLALTSMGWTVKEAVEQIVMGRFGESYLTAASIAFLWMDALYVFLQTNVLSMFVSQSIAAGNPPLAGVWLQVALWVHSLMLVPVMVAWGLTGPLLALLGLPPEVVAIAQLYTLVTLARLPAQVLVDQGTAYFVGRNQLAPGVVTGAAGALLAVGLQLSFALGVPFGSTAIGFPAAVPVVSCVVQWIEAALVFVVFFGALGMHEGYWPAGGWSAANVTGARAWRFSRVAVPAGLSMASDVWRVAALGLAAVLVGDDAVAVFASSYRLAHLAVIAVSALGSSFVVRAGSAFGGGRTASAVLSCEVASVVGLALAATTAAALVAFNAQLGALFSADESFVAAFREARWPMAAFVFTHLVALSLQYVPIALSRPDVVFWVGIVGAWAVQVPAVALLTVCWRADVTAIFVGAAVANAVVIAALLASVLGTDWKRYAREAEERAEMAACEDRRHQPRRLDA